MKSKNGLFLIITPLLMGVAPNNAAIQTVTISSPVFGPYEVYCANKNAAIAVKSGINKKTLVYEKIIFKDLAKDTSRTMTFAEHYIEKGKSYPIPFVMPLNDYLGRSGMNMTVQVFRSEDNVRIKNVSATIYPCGLTTINPIDYVETGYTTNVTAICFPNTSYKETFTFDNFADYFLTDIYYRMPLEQFQIGIKTNYETFPFGTAKLTILDGASLFPLMNTSGSNVVIDLNLSQIGEKYQLIPKNTLYVNPTTLEMSSRAINGYVATNNIYYPVNKIEDLYGTELEFRIENFGNNKTNLIWRVTCYSSSTFIGACSNSEFCVVGGISK